jgi:glutamate/aspartate transport system substrate-binding protein
MEIRLIRAGLARVAGGLLIVLALTAAAPDAASAQPAESVTLARITARKTVTLGVRSDARPFAYVLPSGGPGGFAVDLCRELVNDISAALGDADLSIDYQPVTTENRIEKVVSGAIDMECGSTTRNAQRLRLVAFSPIFYVSGVRLMVLHNSTIRSYRDLSEKTVVVTGGTTGEITMHTLAERLLIRMNFVTMPDNAKSFATLLDGKADAFATDAILLAGLAASPAGRDCVVVGDDLSQEPYGLMFRRNDPEFAKVIDAGFHRLAAQGRLAAIYHRWLTERLPSGDTLNVPMSDDLLRRYRALGQPD